MAEKIKKSIPWLLILALIGLTAGFSFYLEIPKAGADTVTPSVTVENAAPTVSAVELTPFPIVLTENTTTTVTCTATLSDDNGGDDISSATGTIYRSGVSSSCTTDDNNCYQIASANCALGVVVGNDRSATCTADVWFHADPTDAGAYSAETWQCEVTATDAASATGSGVDSTPPELNTLNALIITGSISYGTLAPGATSTDSSTTTATTTGNAAIDVNLSGTDMTTSTFSIAVGQQEYATSSVAYGSGTDLTSTPIPLELDSTKPTANPSNQADDISWKIVIPSGQEPGDYTGTTTVDAITD